MGQSPIREGDTMTNILHAGFTGCAALLLATLLTAPAEARIECRGNFQVTKYGLIATPYCQEEQIAFVARSNGSKVTGAQLAATHEKARTQGSSRLFAV